MKVGPERREKRRVPAHGYRVLLGGTKTFWNRTVVLKPSMDRHNAVKTRTIAEVCALRAQLISKLHQIPRMEKISGTISKKYDTGSLWGSGGSLPFYLPCHLVFFCSEYTLVSGCRTDLKPSQRAVLRTRDPQHPYQRPYQRPYHPARTRESESSHPAAPGRAPCKALFVRHREAHRDAHLPGRPPEGLRTLTTPP